MRAFSVLLINLGLAVGAVSSMSIAAEPPRSASIAFKTEDFDSLADDLGIKIKSGTIEFSKPVSEVRAELRFYKDGKPLDRGLKLQCTPVVSNDVAETFKQVHFAIHIIDLDQLKLGDGQARHSRWRLTLAANESSTSNHDDIPKTEFDLGGQFGSGIFRRDRNVEKRIPVCFFFCNARDKVVRSAYTAEELLAKNPNTDFAILYVFATEATPGK